MRLYLMYLVLGLLFFQKHQVQYRGCFFKTSNATKGSILTVNTIVNPNNALFQITNQEIQRLQQCFGVYVIFYFYDDINGQNAQATDEVTRQDAPDGTIVFGKRLFNREYIKAYGGTTIPIIIAHEFAHIVDYKYGVLNNVGSKKTELFADYLAGFYMYHRVANGITTDVNQCLNSFKSMGDTDFGGENHHGTPEERQAALLNGYSRAQQIHLTQPFIPLTMIIDEGKSYVDALEDDEDDIIIVK